MPMQMMDVFEEHFSEAAFLRFQWERALLAPNYSLAETAELEERLLAHLDGLMLGGESVSEVLLKAALEGEEPGEVFCAAFVSIAGSPPAALEAVLALAPAAPAAVQAALRRALELHGHAELNAHLVPLLRAPEVPVQALALEVLAFRGAVPRGTALELLGHADGRVVTAALRSLGALSRDVARQELPRLLGDKRPNVRMAAIEAGLLSGMRVAWDACRHEAQGSGEGAPVARVLQAICGDDKDAKRLVALAADEGGRTDVLWALGFTGRAAVAEVCLELMGQESPVARLAGEAFGAITGLVVEGAYAMELEEDSLPPLDEDDLDVDLVPGAEDVLQVPVRAAVANWWQRARQDFSRSTRYLDGKPFSGAVLLEALTRGGMRRRQVHAQELALRTQGTHRVQTLSFTARQRAELARAASSCERLPVRPLALEFGG